MALTQKTDFVFKHVNQPGSELTGDLATVKLNLDSQAKELRDYINDTLLVEMASVTDGDSGADNVGATAVTGLTGATVQALLEALNDKINNVNPVAGFVTPEQFTGTAYAKIQSALDYAIANDVAVLFEKMYDITGAGSLSINKANGSWDTDRRVLYLLGIGGGIQKDDAGAVFTAPYQFVGDINVSCLKYHSTVGAGTIIWDCDKIIRVMSSNCQYFNVDTVASAPAQFFQSMRFIKEHITAGSGWAFEFRESYDTTIECLMEARANGIRNTEGLAAVQNRSLRIRDCVIEGLTGVPIKLGSCQGSKISGNYLESNGAATDFQIDLKTLGDSYYQYGLILENNRFTLKASQIAAGTPTVEHGRIYNGDTNGGLVSIANVSDGILHRIGAAELGYILAIGDTAPTLMTPASRASRYINISKNITTTGTYNSIVKWGAVTKQTVTQSASFTGSERKYVDMVMDVPPIAGDPISFSMTNPDKFRIDSHQYITNAVRAYITNLDSGAQSTDITMSCLKLFNA